MESVPAGRLVLLLLLSLAPPSFCGAQELPVKGGPVEMEKEAAQLIEGLPSLGDAPPPEPIPETMIDPSKPLANLTVEQAQARLDQARRKQQRWEKLAKQGILSRVEAERCVIEVAEALLRYQQTRVARAQQELKEIQERLAKGSAEQAMAEAAAAALQSAQEMSASAEAQLRKTRLDTARVNVERQRRLYTAKLISRVQMERAEAVLAKLQAEADKPGAAPAAAAGEAPAGQ